MDECRNWANLVAIANLIVPVVEVAIIEVQVPCVRGTVLSPNPITGVVPINDRVWVPFICWIKPDSASLLGVDTLDHSYEFTPKQESLHRGIDVQ